MMVEDRAGRGLPALEAAAQEIVGAAPSRRPGSSASSRSSTRARRKSTPTSTACGRRCSACRPSRVFEALEIYLGSAYVNDFNYLGRTFRVTAQADGAFRQELRDIGNFKTRSDCGGDGAAQRRRDLPRPDRPLPRGALQSLSRRRGAGTAAARLLDRRRARRDGADRRRDAAAAASPSNGPSSRCRRSSPAIPASSSSSRRSSSSSCCSRRSTRAGRCRSR